MQKIIKILLSLCIFFFATFYAVSPHVIMLSFLSYPGHAKDVYNDVIEGIPVTYFGNRTISDHVGLATFWYEGEKPLVYLLICNQIEPVMAYHNTVSYWKVPPHGAYSFYIIEKKYDAHLKLYFWDIQKTAMESSRIPLNTVVVHVHPDEVDVPTGVVISSKNLQLVLPTIYVKNINLAENVFRFTAISQFFARMNQSYNISKDDLKVNP